MAIIQQPTLFDLEIFEQLDIEDLDTKDMLCNHKLAKAFLMCLGQGL